jgi:hypothetical protein
MEYDLIATAEGTKVRIFEKIIWFKGSGTAWGSRHGSINMIVTDQVTRGLRLCKNSVRV